MYEGDSNYVTAVTTLLKACFNGPLTELGVGGFFLFSTEKPNSLRLVFQWSHYSIPSGHGTAAKDAKHRLLAKMKQMSRWKSEILY